MKIIKFCMSLCCAFAINLSAQTIPTESILNGELYTAQIKLVDEFISRFNLQEQRVDIPDSMQSDTTNLILLFNLQQFKSAQDSLFMMAQDFVNTILKDSVKIKYDDGKWYADISMGVSIAGKKSQCQLFAKFEHQSADMFKWTIYDVESSFFKVGERVPDLYISPTAHEMEFMEIEEAFKETPQLVSSFLLEQYVQDNLSVFAVMLANRVLKIESIKDVKFVFEQVPGYRFYVSYFARDSRNSGWLINKLEKTQCN